MAKPSEAAIEAAARKLTELKGGNPDSLSQIHVFTGGELFDFEDQYGRRFLKLWKVHNKGYAEAALTAAYAIDGSFNAGVEAAARVCDAQAEKWRQEHRYTESQYMADAVYQER